MGKRSNLQQRLITGSLFAAVLIICVVVNEWAVAGLFGIITALSVWEFYSMIRTESCRPHRSVGILLSVIIYSIIIAHLNNFISSMASGLISYVLMMSLFIFELYRKREQPILNTMVALGSILYLVVPYSLFVSLGYLEGNYNYHLPLGFLILLWCSDSLAYVFGSRFGKHRLFERISPKKSWEGFIGALISNQLIAYFILGSLFPVLNGGEWLAVSIVIVVFGTWGDLVESMFKRSVGVKDSGSILPGHGGILDRFDGLFIAVPMVYSLCYLFLKS